MIYMLYLLTIINILLIILLFVCYLYSNKEVVQPKLKAILGLYLCGIMIIYLFMLTFVGIYGIVVHKYKLLILFIFVFVPFVIGNFATYKTVAKYTFIQLFVALVNLLFLFYLLCL